MFLFVATFTVGCNQEPTISQQIDTAQTETVNAARDMKDYTFAQKAEFVTKMQGRLGALNEDLDQLSARIESASDAIKADAKLKLQALRDQSAEFMSKENDAGSNINREGDGSIVERRSGRRISPLLAHNTASTIAAAKELSARAGRPNLFIKIPGTKEGLPAIEEAIFAGVPINVTLLFSREQYVAAAEAYLRGIERRIAAGLNPQIGSVASMFISRWDVAVAGKVPEALHNWLGIAIAGRIYKAYVEVLCNPRWQRAYNAGARPQRLLWASTGTKDPKASDILYINALASPFTVNTMPDETLKALADHGEIGSIMAADGGDCEAVLAQFLQAGINVDALAAQLQDEGAKSFVKSWNELIAVIASKSAALKKAA